MELVNGASINGSGIQWPTLRIGDHEYQVKFTGGTLYSMQKRGINFAAENVKREDGSAAISMKFTTIVECLHAAVRFPGTVEELADLVFDMKPACVDALCVAWVKAFPPQTSTPATAGNEAGNTLN